MTQGAKGLRVALNILEIEADTTLRVEMYWSYDGRNWNSSVVPIDFLDSSASTGFDSAGFYTWLYTGLPTRELVAPYVRYAIKVTGDTGQKKQGRARVAASVTALACAPRLSAVATIVGGQAIVDNRTDTPVGPVVATAGLSKMVLNGELSTPAPGASLVLKVQTCTEPDENSTLWTTVYTAAGISALGPFVLNVTDGVELAAYSRIVYTSGTPMNSTVLRLDGILRSF